MWAATQTFVLGFVFVAKGFARQLLMAIFLGGILPCVCTESRPNGQFVVHNSLLHSLVHASGMCGGGITLDKRNYLCWG